VSTQSVLLVSLFIIILFRCDACHNAVQGIRFDCIHCSSLIFCEKCEQRSTLAHSNEQRDEQKQQHIFRLIARPENDNGGQ
jgi:hypothetical protein